VPVLDVLGSKRHAVEATDTDDSSDPNAHNTVRQKGNREGKNQTEEPPPAFGSDDRADQEECGDSEKSAEQQVTSPWVISESSLTNRA